MKVADYSIRHPVVITMLLAVLIVFGIIAGQKLTQELYPPIELPTATIVTVYPGASALDVEDQVTDEIEKTVSQISGLDSLTCTSRTSVSVVSVNWQLTAGLGIQLPVFDGGRRAVGGDNASVEAALADRENAMDQIQSHVYHGVARISGLNRQTELQRQLLDNATRQVTLAGTQYKAGTATESSLIRRRLDLFSLETKRLQLVLQYVQEYFGVLAVLPPGAWPKLD